MKIETGVWKNFLNKIYTDGTITETILSFEDDGVHSSNISFDSIVGNRIFLPKKSFMNYKSIGKIGIDNVKRIIKLISLFNDDDKINLVFDKNKMFIKSSNRNIETILPDPSFIKGSIDLKSMEYQNSIDLKSQVLKQIVSNLSAADGKQIHISVRGKNLSISCGENDRVTEIIKNEKFIEDVSAKYSELFKRIVNSITEDTINLRLKTNFPLTMIEKGSQINSMWIISPIVRENDIDTKKEEQVNEGNNMDRKVSS